MGWTTCNKPSYIKASDFILQNCFEWSNDAPATYTVLDSGIVKLRTFYAAVERIEKATGERTVFACVVLLGFWPKSRTGNFGWKIIGEAAGPNEAQCPKRILDLLTPTDDENANDWRKRCLDTIAARKERPNLDVGMTIELFSNKYRITQNLGRRGFMIEGITLQGIYRLRTTQFASCTIVSTPEN